MLKALSPYIIWGLIPILIYQSGELAFYYSLIGFPSSLLILLIFYRKKLSYLKEIIIESTISQRWDFFWMCIFSSLGQIVYVFIFLSDSGNKPLAYFISSSYGLVYYFLAHFFLERSKINTYDVLIILIGFTGLLFLKKDGIDFSMGSSVFYGTLRAIFGGASSFFIKRMFWTKKPRGIIDLNLIAIPRLLLQLIIVFSIFIIFLNDKFVAVHFDLKLLYIVVPSLMSYCIAYSNINYSLYYFKKITVVNLGNLTNVLATISLSLFIGNELGVNHYIGIFLIISASYISAIKNK